MKRLAWLPLLLLLLLAAEAALAAQPRVRLVEFESVVNPVTAHRIVRAIDDAEAEGDDLVLIQLDTPGGLVASMETIEGAVVKWAKGFHSAQTLTPEAAREVIRTRAASAVSRIDEFEPYVLETPIELELSLKHYQPVELLAYLPNVERVNSHTIRFMAENMTEASKFLTFVLNYRVDLQP